MREAVVDTPILESVILKVAEPALLPRHPPPSHAKIPFLTDGRRGRRAQWRLEIRDADGFLRGSAHRPLACDENF